MTGLRVTLGRSLRWHAARCFVCLGVFSTLAIGPDGAVAADPAEEIRKAAQAYVDAFKKADAAALADQWTKRATLVEGDSTLEGREAIVAALVAWRKQHPDCDLAVDVTDIDIVAEPLARVTGTIRFTPRAGAKPTTARFTSLRVREGTAWRLAESVVVPEHSAALDDLDWLVGKWKAAGAGAADASKEAVEIVYSKPLGDSAIIGQITYQGADRPAVKALEVIHGDRATGQVRSWIFDSTGARAEGVIESDGTTFHKTMVGTPAEGAAGHVARWVQIIAPTGDGRCTVHAIERSVDDVPVPDDEPLHFRKVAAP